nr:hypothetical protein Iba_chr01bCG17070 [Ipomoea batatas]
MDFLCSTFSLSVSISVAAEEPLCCSDKIWLFMVWQLTYDASRCTLGMFCGAMNAFTSLFSSEELVYFSNGGGIGNPDLFVEDGWEVIDVRALKCDGGLTTRILLNIPFPCLKMRVMLWFLVSQTRIVPSSDPDTNRDPSILKAKHVMPLLFQVKEPMMFGPKLLFEWAKALSAPIYIFPSLPPA